MPKICWRGEIWFDLINRLENKVVLRGIKLDEKVPAGIKNNYTKIMDFLKKKEKMNRRYLNAEYHLIA